MSSTFFDHSMTYRYTWYSNDQKTRKIIDHVLVEKYIQEYITNCIVQLEYDFDSDHRLLTTTLRTPCTRKARRKPKRPPKQPVSDKKTLYDPTIREKYVDSIDTYLRNSPTHICPSEMSENIIHILNSAAADVLPKKSKSESNYELWKRDERMNQLLKERSRMNMGSLAYKELSKKIKRRIALLRNEKLRREAEEINDYANFRQIEELFRNIKSDGSTFKNIHHKLECDIDKLQTHFMNHFKANDVTDDPIELMESPDFIKQLQEIGIDIDTSPPDHVEILAVLGRLKNGKAGNDIHAEFLKYAVSSKELINELERMYNTIWTTRVIPKSWRHSKLVSLWKGSSKGSAKDPTTYRGIQIGSTLCKIMAIMIMNRIRKWYELQLLDQQQGFRSGRGTADGIFIVKRIQQITDKMRKPVFLLFIDLTAAFDHVVREWLFKAIYQRFPEGADKSIFELLESLYKYTTTSLAETPDNVFELMLGVRQGGPESPPLFNLYMDFVMRIYMDRCGKEDIKFLKLQYRIPSSATTREERLRKSDKGNYEADWAGYADDLTLIFDDADSLQKGLDTLDEIFNQYHLSINIKKTKTMILNHKILAGDNTPYPKSICNLNGFAIENVTTFRYLGDEIKHDEPSTGDAEIELRIDAAESKFYELSKKLLNYKILIKTRILILNSMVRSRLTYSCQTWNLTSRQTDRINSVYTSMLRKMVKGGYRRKNNTEWNFLLNNSDLHRICGTEKISDYTARQQKKYLAHLARQPNTTFTKKLLFNDNKAHKPGRQGNLENSVLTNEQCTANAFYKKALNREY